MRKILSKSFVFILILTLSLVFNQQFIFAATTLGSNDHLKCAFFSHLVYSNLDKYTNKKLIDINFFGDKNIAEFSNGFIDAIMDKETYEGKKLSIYLKQNNLISLSNRSKNVNSLNKIMKNILINQGIDQWVISSVYNLDTYYDNNKKIQTVDKV